jgi:diguanylate cyclase (GGDEF)-like protein/PAS domain S-box-containing protein
MLAEHVAPLFVGLQYVVATLAGAVAVQQLLTRRWAPGRAGLWFAASTMAVSLATASELWLFLGPSSQVNVALSVRDVLYVAIILVVVPAVAAMTGRSLPRLGFGALVVYGCVRIVLYQTTDLVNAHRTLTDGAPVYGSLAWLFTLPMLLWWPALVVWVARGWEDRTEKAVFLAGVVGSVLIAAAAFAAGTGPVSEVVRSCELVPGVAGLQVIFARRVLALVHSSDRLARERAVALASLGRAERRSRLALESGRLGWFEYNYASGKLATSPRLVEMMGPARAAPATIDEALRLFHPQDRARVRVRLEGQGPEGPETVEARLAGPNGPVAWVELSALRTETGNGNSEVVGVLKDVTERKHAEEERLRASLTDPLTGLPNRARFAELALAALAANDELCVVMVGIESFGEVNATLGRNAADKVLVGVAERLRAAMRQGDVVAYFGQGSFAVLVSGPAERPMAIAARLLDDLHDAIDVEGIAIKVRARAGVACAPADTADAAALLRLAEASLEVAKRQGRGCHRYDAGDDLGVGRRLQLAGQLPAALRSSEIEVHYQPSIELSDGRCEVLEALVRWRHPQFGLVAPAEFVPLADQYGLGRELVRRVLADALAQCSRWRAQELARLVFVNVSPGDLGEPGFVGCVTTELARAGLPGDALALEVTEGVFAGQGSGAIEVLAELRDLGVRSAIDDFGTGYSSLSYLGQLPVCAIKLDQSFVASLGSGLNADAVVPLVVGVGHKLGLVVVAEGVETAEQLEAVRDHGCDVAQGYFLCRPGPADAITEWLLGNAKGRPFRHLRLVGEGGA